MREKFLSTYRPQVHLQRHVLPLSQCEVSNRHPDAAGQVGGYEQKQHPSTKAIFEACFSLVDLLFFPVRTAGGSTGRVPIYQSCQRTAMRYRYPLIFIVFLLLILQALPAEDAAATDLAEKSTGQTVYVPAYSHIYHGNKDAPLLLSVTLSIRNTDMDNPITISVVDYYDTKGTLLRHFINAPVTLGPIGSERYIISQKDKSGGSGANFIVTWHSQIPTNPPIIETVMIGTQSQLGISFTSRGQALQK